MFVRWSGLLLVTFGIAVSLASVSAPPTAADSGVLDFLRAQQDRRFEKVPRQVLAFYYSWYGTPERHGRWIHWGVVDPEKRDISESTNYPALGAYDSHDPEIVDGHIDLAREYGLTGFIATWWGRGDFTDRAFRILIDRAEAKDFKVSIYWEVAPLAGEEQIDFAVNDLLHVLREFGSRKAFLKVDGKPVVFVYGRVMDQVPAESWPVIIRRTRAALGRDFLLIADGYREANARTFDGVHTYNICHWVGDRASDELRALARSSFRDAVALAKRHRKVSCLTVIPGYDDTKIRTPGLKAARRDGETYRVLWDEAIAADPDWVLVTSWNEWHEGSEIEPSHEDGDAYVRLTGEYAARFRATPHSRATVGADDRTPTRKMAGELGKLYEGMTIGVLPDFGSDLVYWLLDAGLEVRELTWNDVLDPERFRASQVQLAVYAAGERYVRTVEDDDDVIRALRRYLRGGGTLLVAPHLPHPFFYDETGATVLRSAQVGVPIWASAPMRRDVVEPHVSSWETPPVTGLTFHARAPLALDAAAAPFPKSGDVRWRPASGSVVGAADVYVPLASLRDARGNHYGDGIVYVEHREGALAGGKSVYVWMRMQDVFGRNTLNFALLKFVAEKLRASR